MEVSVGSVILLKVQEKLTILCAVWENGIFGYF